MKNRIKNYLYIYRYDFISLSLVFSIIVWFLSPIFTSGHIVFSDLDFPLDSTRYLEEITGLWNNRWNTPTMLNLPRLFYIFPFWFISNLLNNDGSLLIKSFISGNLLISSLSIYIFTKSIIRIYLGDNNSLSRLLAISIGSIFYAVNPWVVYRIQHIYLICGYSLLPLALHVFFKIFDPKFQEILIPGYSPFRIKLYRKNIIHIGLLSIIISIMSAAIHYFFYTIILIVLLWILLLAKQQILYKDTNYFLKKAIFLNYFTKALLLALFTLIFCYYWFSIYFGSILIDAQSSQHNINVVDTLSLFSKYSSIDKSVLLISYWWPMFDLKTLPLTFYIGGVIILLVIFLGIISYGLKNHILLFLLILTSIFLIISTGTSAPIISDFFVKLVMDVPFFGNLFRDPNKLLGIVAISYSIFIVFGIEKIFSLKLKNESILFTVKTSFFAITLLGTILYITPFRNRFVKGFYNPVKVPSEYSKIQSKMNKSDYRVLNLPTSGSMVDTSTGVSTPDWNINPDNLGYNKATADFTIYQSSKNTIFHHEGSDPAISHYFDFLQYMMDFGLTDKLNIFMQPFGVDQFLYTRGYLGQKNRQEFNLKILSSQKGINLFHKDNYFHLYSFDNLNPTKGVLDNIIYTSKGLQLISSLAFINDFSFKNSGVVFNSQTKGNPLINIRPGDYIETTTIDELLLSSLQEKYYTQPAKHVKNGNPFFGWSQSAIHSSDWLWHLKSQNIRPLRFDKSFLSGIALSFSSVKLNIPIHKKNNIQGKKYIDFERFLLEGYTFTSNNKSLVDIETYPLSIETQLPLIHGIISKGQNYNIWQVGKSGLIPADPETPYQFFLTISGRGSNRMHLKARFYNKDRDEIATAYILTPEDKINFEYFKFFGEYITPKNTSYVRIDILTYQRPEQKVHWWIHDFSILELSEYSIPNTINYSIKLKSKEPLIPFARLFYSPQADYIKISLDEKEEIINTKKTDFSGFLWTRLDTLYPQNSKVDISIENSSGFNAINELVFLTETEYLQERFKAERALDIGTHFISMEAEYDFNYLGSVQTKRNYTNLSMGKGKSSFNGLLETQIELPEDGYYNIDLSVAGEENLSNFKIDLKHSDKSISFNSYSSIKKIENLETNSLIIDEVFSDDEYFKHSIDKDINYKNIQDINIKTKPLKKGVYDCKITLLYTGISLTNISRINYFNPQTVLVPDYISETENDGYSECISLYPTMINHKVINNTLHIKYDPSCSADWYISSSQKIKVEPEEEYIFHFNLTSENLVKRHTKILYLNKLNQVIKTDYIPEVEERDKKLWNNYQFISKAPKNSTAMLFQIWGRANKKLFSTVKLNELKVYKYNNLPLLDRVYISKTNKSDLFAKSITNIKKNSYSIMSEHSPHPIWILDNNGEKVKSATTVNSVKSLYFTNSESNNTIKLQLEKHYYLGFILWPVGILLLIALYLYYKKRGTLKTNIKRFLRSLIIKK